MAQPFNQFNAGSSRCSTSSKSLPNGNFGSRPLRCSGASDWRRQSGRLRRQAAGITKSSASLPCAFASAHSASRKQASLIDSIASTHSLSLLPRRSATPYSVT